MKQRHLAVIASVFVLMGLSMCVAAEDAAKERPDAKEPVFDVSKITLKVTDAALGDVLRALAEQSGNLPLHPPDKWKGKPLTLDLADVGYWQALDAVCAQMGLTVTPWPRMRALQLVPKKDSADVTVHTGSFAVTLHRDRMRRSRRRINNVDGPESLRCPFSVMWEDRLPTLTTEVVVMRVTEPDGTELELRSRDERLMHFAVTGEIAPVARDYTDVVNLPEDLKKFREIEGVVRVSFGMGKDVMTIKDVLAGGAKSATVGKSTLTAEKLIHQRGVCFLRLRETFEGKEVNPSTYPASSPYGVCLVDPKGARHAGISRWGGPMRREGQIIGPDGKPDGGILVKGTGQTLVHFRDLPTIPGAWSLVHTVPERTVVREYPFKFTNIPLPEAKAPKAPRPAARVLIRPMKP